jgi:hypothetical protein
MAWQKAIRGTVVPSVAAKVALAPIPHGRCGLRIGQPTELSPAVPYLVSGSQRTFQYQPQPVSQSQSRYLQKLEHQTLQYHGET